jgi:hypothetical protein
MVEVKANSYLHQIRLCVLVSVFILGSTSTAQAAFSDADYEAHVEKLKKNLPKGFTIIIEKPFVVIGDERAATVKMRSEKTVRWCTQLLKKQYFKKDPNTILNVFLFKDKASYEKHMKSFWNETPTTPYGFYSSTKRALVMNISTGGGTLVHEIVHPFVESNFPNCPSWFNEGLGSLYEQCRERNGKIVGLTNWRLAGLQRAILKKQLPTFKKLMGTTSFLFYNKDRGSNYAQARYLLYYLQETDQLQAYFDAFIKNRREDPHGYITLKKVLKLDDEGMLKFQKKWETYVLKLKFR